MIWNTYDKIININKYWQPHQTTPDYHQLKERELEQLPIRDIFYHCNKFKYNNVKYLTIVLINRNELLDNIAASIMSSLRRH